MQFSFFMAKRYLFSKKSHNLVNIISFVSMIGLLIGTAALIVVLSVFNGFEEVISSLYNTFQPDFTITPKMGKVFNTAEFPLEKLNNLPGVKAVVKVIEEDALFKYDNKQTIGRIMGLSANFRKVSSLDTMMQTGDFVLQSGNADFALAGAGIAWFLGINIHNPQQLLTILVPRRGNASSFNFQNAFRREAIPVAGIFSVQQQFDQKYVLVPLRFANRLLNYHNQISAYNIYLKNNTFSNTVQAELISLSGKKFVVKNRFQQNETLYKIMKSEKMAVFFILVFILILSSFNMIGSISILIVEKRKDLAVLKSMGADIHLLRQIFFKQGILISLMSAIGGLFFGFVILWLQQHYGFVKLGNGNGGFIINAYPVMMVWKDFVVVFFTVVAIGLIASWYPVRFLLKNYQNIKLS